jgi:hypothetical protein
VLFLLSVREISASNKPEAAKPVPDYVVKLYDAKPESKLQGEDLASLPNSISCASIPFTVLPEADKIQPDDGKTVFIINVLRWTIQDGAYSLDKNYKFPSEWYVYERKQTKGACKFEQTGFKAHGEPLIYAKKTAWFMGINHFSAPVDSRNLTINYKVSVTPGIPQNIQNLGALISAITGAAAPALIAPLAAAKPVAPDTLVTIARIDGVRPLPFLINFAYGFAVTPPGGLPDGRVGVPYSASVAASGGNGNYRYIVSAGSLPAGLGLDPTTGMISGTPTAPGDPSFTIQVADSSAPPAGGAFPAKIAVSSSNQIPLAISSETVISLTPGEVGSPYADGFYGSAGTAPYSFEVAAGTLPSGLYLNPSGLISGVPKQQVVNQQFSVVMHDSANPPKASNSFYGQISVGPPETSLTVSVIKDVASSGSLPLITKGTWFATLLKATGGAAPTNITIATLPTGLTFGAANAPSTFILSGIPAQSGDSTLKLHIEDSGDPKMTRDVEVKAVITEPLLSLSLGASQPQSTPSQQGGNQPKSSPGNQNQPGNKPPGNTNNPPNNNPANNSGSPNTPTVPTVDCTVVNQASPCSFSHNLQSDDRELIDFSVGVSIPGVREAVYTSATTTPSIKRHTDLYGIVDLYPFCRWKNNETAIPNLSLGMPLTSQPFYRPYFGLSENLTTWSGFEKLFPLRVKLFAGVVVMKQRILVPGPEGQSSPLLKSERITKTIAGIEIPIGPMVSKISGGKSQTSSKGQGQNQSASN